MVSSAELIISHNFSEESFYGLVRSLIQSIGQFKFEAVTLDQNTTLNKVLVNIKVLPEQIELRLNELEAIFGALQIQSNALKITRLQFPPQIPPVKSKELDVLVLQFRQLLSNLNALDDLVLVLEKLFSVQSSGSVSINTYSILLDSLSTVLIMNDEEFLHDRTIIELASIIIRLSTSLENVVTIQNKVDEIVILLNRFKLKFINRIIVLKLQIKLELGRELIISELDLEGLEEGIIVMKKGRPSAFSGLGTATGLRTEVVKGQVALHNFQVLQKKIFKIIYGQVNVSQSSNTSCTSFLGLVEKSVRSYALQKDYSSQLNLASVVTELQSLCTDEFQFQVLLNIVNGILADLTSNINFNIQALINLNGLRNEIDFDIDIKEVTQNIKRYMLKYQEYCTGMSTINKAITSWSQTLRIGSLTSEKIGLMISHLFYFFQVTSDPLQKENTNILAEHSTFYGRLLFAIMIWL